MRLGALLAIAAAATSVDAVTIRIKVHSAEEATTTAEADMATTTATTASSWHMSKVTAYQARVQGNAPAWDTDNAAWGGSYGSDFAAKYRSVLDSVNTASVEGALMYLQAEGINAPEQSVKCQRKNKMQYIVFYKLEIVQPTGSLAYYAGNHEPSEYCPFVAMDSGMCTLAGTSVPDACKRFEGTGGEPDLGPCVGANEQSTDPRAPYPGNYWFSFPNSCPYTAWSNKTDACREQYPGGLCAFGKEPDGESCTFSYSIMGYLNIDDLVGITDGSAAGGAKFSNFTEFCNAGNVEFSAKNTGSGFTDVTSIPFWENPGDQKANAKRTQIMIDTYNKLSASPKVGTMEALPLLSAIKNPPCYENSKECATAKNGCRRKLYAQLCEVCDTAAADCVVAPSDFTFPTLTIPTAAPATTATTSSGSSTGSKTSSASSKASSKANDKTSAASPARATASLIGAMALALAMAMM